MPDTPHPRWSDLSGNRQIRLALLALWFVIVLFTATRHAFWRDEVRALSIALSGPNLFVMFQRLHGEGHPAVWYFLLRGLHTLLPVPQVLPLAAFLVASAAALLLVLRSPFRWPVIALLLFGNALIFEYPIMARNYGISMLALFLLATLYPKHRDHGCWLGIVLFLLSNCNAHSVLLGLGFLVFWFVDILTEESALRKRLLRVFLGGLALDVLGILFCLFTISTHTQNAVSPETAHGTPLVLLFKAVFLPAASFEQTEWFFRGNFLPLGHGGIVLFEILLSLLFIGSTLGLVRWPGAFLAALGTLLTFSVFFTFIYRGFYRHEALWLCFLIAMYWIAGSKQWRSPLRFPPRLEPYLSTISRFGWSCFLLLMGLQTALGLRDAYLALNPNTPWSRSRDLGTVVRGRPDLKDAVILADPDYLVEALPYYLPNPTYLLREHRFGPTVLFTKDAQLKLSLAGILATARDLRDSRHQPVVILLAVHLDPLLPPHAYHESYVWELSTTPEQVRSFLDSTALLRHFGPTVSDETYDVYLLK
jgi:hypothetical protein